MKNSILIIEDDASIRNTLKLLIAMEMPEVETAEAENGEQAIEMLRKGYRPSVILLDLMMPVMNGVEFLEIKSHCDKIAAIPVVVLTAASNHRQHMKDHNIPYLKKPIDMDLLLSWIYKLLPKHPAG